MDHKTIKCMCASDSVLVVDGLSMGLNEKYKLEPALRRLKCSNRSVWAIALVDPETKLLGVATLTNKLFERSSLLV